MSHEEPDLHVDQIMPIDLSQVNSIGKDLQNLLWKSIQRPPQLI